MREKTTARGTALLSGCAAATTLLLLSALGCSNHSSPSSVGASCDSVGLTCGTFDAGDSTVDCGRCSFSATPILSPGASFGGSPTIVSTPQGLVVAFYSNGSGVFVSREQPDGGFNGDGETVDGNAQPDPLGDDAPSLAIAADGTTWVAYDTQNPTPHVRVARGTVGADGGVQYTTADLPTGYFPALALNAAGEPHVVFTQRGSSVESVHHDYEGPDGGWLDEIIESTSPTTSFLDFSFPGVVFDAKGELHAFYPGASDGGYRPLRHATQAPAGGAFSVENLPGANSATSQVSAAIDAAGNLHVLWQAASSPLMYSLKTSGGWQTSQVRENGVGTSIALDSSGRPHVAFRNVVGEYGEGGGPNWSTWASQDVTNCSGHMALAIDAHDSIYVAQSCQGLNVLTLSGKYPSTYEAECHDLSQTVLQKGTQCALDGGYAGTCVVAQNGNGFCDNDARQAEFVETRLCGNAAQDAGTVADCASIASSLQCVFDSNINGGVDALQLTGSCDLLWKNR